MRRVDSWGQICALRVPHEMGVRWKSQKRKNVYLSPYVEEPSNSKVIKSFVPELRSRKCFPCFGIPMFYVYMLWTFYVHFPYSCMAMLQIYPSLFIWNGMKGLRKGYVREVSWRLNKDCNILIPSYSSYNSTSFSFSWAVQPGALRAQFLLALTLASFSKTLTPTNWLPVALGYIIVWLPPASVSVASAPNSTRQQSRLSSDIFDRMHLLFTQVHFLFDSLAGSRVNMLQFDLLMWN